MYVLDEAEHRRGGRNGGADEQCARIRPFLPLDFLTPRAMRLAMAASLLLSCAVFSWAFSDVQDVRVSADPAEAQGSTEMIDLGSTDDSLHGGESRAGYIRGPTAIEMARAMVVDTDAAECLHKGLTDADTLCQLKTTQAECEGSSKDWYCDPAAGQQCEGDQCRIVVMGGFDIMQSAYCCKWSGSACTFNTTSGAGNFCTGTYDECSDVGANVLTCFRRMRVMPS